MLDAIRHRVNISYYRASDAHGTYFNRIVIFDSWITSSSSVLFSGGQARHLRLSFYYLDYSSWITRALLTCTACTFSVSQLWISSLTVHLRYARHVQSYRGVYYYVVFRLLGVRLLVFLWGRNCVVGICCGCPPFFLFLSRSRLNGY